MKQTLLRSLSLVLALAILALAPAALAELVIDPDSADEQALSLPDAAEEVVPEADLLLPVPEEAADAVDAAPAVASNAPADEAAAESNAASDFTIDGTTLVKYNGAGGAVTVPSTVKKIGKEAFAYSAVTSVTIPDSVTYIGVHAFEFCEKLKTVRLPANLTKLQSDTFNTCRSLTSIAIPGKVTSIGRYCFAECVKLSTVVLPEGVKTLNENAFFMCEGLKSATLPTTLTTLHDNVFAECFNVNVYVHAGSTAEYLSRYLYDIKKVTVIPSTKDVFFLDPNNKGSTRTAAVGDKITIKTPGDTAKAYKSSKPSVATVSKKGVVTVKKKGTATITVTMIDNVKLTFKISASKAVKPTKVSFPQGSSVTMKVGSKLQLGALLKPANGRSALTWKSKNSKIASVSSSGLVTAKTAGTVKIIVTAKTGKKTATITIKVVK